MWYNLIKKETRCAISNKGAKVSEKTLKIALIGAGCRGYALVTTICLIKNAEISVIVDPYLDKAGKAAELAKELSGHEPIVMVDYKNAFEYVDAVIVCTAWEYHAEIAVEAMYAGKIVGLDVGGAYNLNECWALVNACF